MRGNKIAPLQHSCLTLLSTSTKGVQFYCPSRTYPSIPFCTIFPLLEYCVVHSLRMIRQKVIRNSCKLNCNIEVLIMACPMERDYFFLNRLYSRRKPVISLPIRSCDALLPFPLQFCCNHSPKRRTIALLPGICSLWRVQSHLRGT